MKNMVDLSIVFLCLPEGNSHQIPLKLWFSYGFPMVFLWFLMVKLPEAAAALAMIGSPCRQAARLANPPQGGA